MSDTLTDAQVIEAADFLDEATANGLPLPLIPESCRPQSAADGGRIYWERWSRNQRPAVAWKAAVIEGDMVLAPFFDGMVLDSPGLDPRLGLRQLHSRGGSRVPPGTGLRPSRRWTQR